jgi:nucleoside-diphosphate-sugar epimerase
MKILVTGANGFLGKVLCKELRRHSYAVIAAYRSMQQHVDQIEHLVVGSIDKNTDWSVALQAVDVVVHLAARVHAMKETSEDSYEEFRKINVDGTLHLAMQAAKAGVKRFIFMSSIKVNGEFTEIGKPFLEEHPASPKDSYGLSKYEAEQGLFMIAQQTGMEVVVIRPPLVYGAGVKANFASMMRAVKRELPLPLGAIYNKRSFVYVDNLVSLILRCIVHPAAANQVFLVSDNHDLSTTELLQACAVALGVKPRLLSVPQGLIEIGARLLGKRSVAQRLCGHLQVDISKARRLLDWTPPVSVIDGLKVTAIHLKQGEQ